MSDAPAPALFISDLHLSGAQAESLRRFHAFMKDQAADSSALYILGDLFEYWIGDDVLLERPPADPAHAEVVAALRDYSAAGRTLRILHGNRDFLLAGGFLDATGAELIADSTVVGIDSQPTLLLHGDALCTDDADYQRFKAEVRSDAWQQDFLRRPLSGRRALATDYRAESDRVKSGHPDEIMDVNAAAVAEAFTRSGVRRMIHGHTHRPGYHRILIGAHTCERWVLPDWYRSGGYLSVGSAGPRLMML